MTKPSLSTKRSFFLTAPEDALAEIIAIAAAVADDFDAPRFRQCYGDARKLFDGTYPGYRASNTEYHDFPHTVSVVLATARLIHGCFTDGYAFTARQVLLTLVAALFHDAGLIQQADDTQGSGAKYTIGHEERSIVFLRAYAGAAGFSKEDIDICGDFIRCTILSYAPSEIAFTDNVYRTLGNIVGTADLMAQMADRLYLEKLLLLYKEFEEARLPGFDSELQLLRKTKAFYEIVATQRFEEALNNVGRHMRSHFRSWWDRDFDGYAEAIRANIHYLDGLIDKCRDSFRCYLENLKRGGIARPLLESLPPE